MIGFSDIEVCINETVASIKVMPKAVRLASKIISKLLDFFLPETTAGAVGIGRIRNNDHSRW